MSENVGIETRSRSRSKTPGLLFAENGDSNEKKGSKKIPTISLIEEEEDVVEVVSSQSQRPKRQRRSAKAVQSDTSGDVTNDSPKNSQKAATEAVANSKQTTKSTTTTVVTTKQIINGSEEKKEETTATTTTTTQLIANTNTESTSEAAETQNIFNNIFNAIKTSTPILSNKRSKRVTQEISSTEKIDYNAHPAYKEYKEAGEYWNKYPKTDYTYSELSPHRRELGAGVVAMPNMSRRSLDKYQNRVETMIQNNPLEESFIRRKFLGNMSYQKRSADLQYDSADEIDVSDLHQKLSARHYSQSNFFRRFFLLIINTFTTAYSNAKQGVQRLYYGNNQRYAYTPTRKYHQEGIWRRAYNFIQRFVLLCISKVYLLISTILCLDTWLLYTRSENAVENRKRKKFLLGLLILFPLLLFGGTYIYLDPPQNISLPKLTLPQLPKISFPKITFPSITLPSFNVSWPELSFPAWLKLPEFSFSWPTFTLPSWFKLPSFSFNMPEFSFAWPEFSWPVWLALPTLTWPSWLKWPEFSFEWPSISLSWPEWLKFPQFSLPEFSFPSFSWPSFEFLDSITTFTVDKFTALKLSSIEFFDKIRDVSMNLLNEIQIVWNENFNVK